MRDIEIFGIHKDYLDTAWNDISPLIDMALKRTNDELDLDEIYHMIKNDQVIPVIMMHKGIILSVVTLEVVQKKKKRILSLMTAGGTDLDDWLDEFMDVAEQIAIEQECDDIYVTGRKGWQKKLKRYGFEYRYTVLSRRIN